MARPAAMHAADAMTEAQEMMEQSSAWAAKTSCSGVTLTASCGRKNCQRIRVRRQRTVKGMDSQVSCRFSAMEALLGAAAAVMAMTEVTIAA